MSDPVTNVDVEDVLASIRRLISQDSVEEWQDTSQSKDHKGQPAVQEDEDRTSRFLLTPALRIVGADDTASNQPEDTSSVLPKQSLSLDRYAVSEGVIKDAETPETTEDLDLSEVIEEHVRHATMKATIAELEAAIGDQEDDYEPDEGEPEPSTPLWFQSYAKAEQELYAGRSVPPIHAEPRREKKVGSSLQPAEMSGSEALDEVAESPTETAGRNLAEIPDNSVAIDEEALRELVIGMVRSELQGALGERITRNVRKLVRREIYRVMSEQGLIE
jgi:cell pole-organizing protein PopZ